MYYGKINRWYNENRGKFWKIVLIIICVIFFIQVANQYYLNKSTSSNNTNTVTTSTTELEKINNNMTSGEVTGTSSLVSGSNMSSTQIEKASTLIDSFIKYCNEKDIENAYELLTDECKELLYPTRNDFERIYYKKLYLTPKTYKLQNWSGNTYRINLSEDALTTGKVNGTSFQDYITVKDNKLNINSYIGRKNINKTTNVKGITFNVLYKDTFMDYEIYELQIKNLSENVIKLDDGKDANSISIRDDNGVSNYAYSGEIDYDNMTLEIGQTKSLTLKFSNTYSVTRTMRDIVFGRVIMEYDKNLKNYEVEKVIINI